MASEPLIERLWYGGHPAYKLLLPLSWLFAGISRLRRALYRLGVLRSQRLSVPVIVVGNISAGGVGKTPVVIDLVERLKQAGWRPGVISRGYGGKTRKPTRVSEHSNPAQAGDEPVLIARQTQVPVVVAPRRADAARVLAASGVNLIVADDGLQHYALERDIEIAVVDAQRRHGNGQLLPAGPLRELPSRLDQVDLVLVSGPAQAGEYTVSHALGPVRHLNSGKTRALDTFSQVQAVAGIGQPEKFFRALEQAGLTVKRHAFADHHRFVAGDLKDLGQGPVLMTEKDAVKCARFRDARLWAVEYHAHIDDAAWTQICARLDALQQGK